jgi:hypothetical protein
MAKNGTYRGSSTAPGKFLMPSQGDARYKNAPMDYERDYQVHCRITCILHPDVEVRHPLMPQEHVQRRNPVFISTSHVVTGQRNVELDLGWPLWMERRAGESRSARHGPIRAQHGYAPLRDSVACRCSHQVLEVAGTAGHILVATRFGVTAAFFARTPEEPAGQILMGAEMFWSDCIQPDRRRILP